MLRYILEMGNARNAACRLLGYHMHKISTFYVCVPLILWHILEMDNTRKAALHVPGYHIHKRNTFRVYVFRSCGNGGRAKTGLYALTIHIKMIALMHMPVGMFFEHMFPATVTSNFESTTSNSESTCIVLENARKTILQLFGPYT